MNEKDIITLKNSMLFKDMNDKEITEAVNSLSVTKKFYKKDELILMAGSTTNFLGMVLSGSLTIEINDVWGNRTILSYVEKGEFFAEAFAILQDELVSVDVNANEESEIALFDMSMLHILKQTYSEWLLKLLNNLLMISVQKNMMLSQRSIHTSSKSARGRIMAFLNNTALKTKTTEFTIPFNRQQMADYLNLDRSALSKELGKMRDDGMIKFRKNYFKIIKQ